MLTCFLVITKPDRFQKGESLKQWDQILSGERYKIGFGYFVVKNNPDTTVNHATARREEEVFFREQDPWSTMLKKHKDGFGTPKLVTALSQKLTEQIRTRYASHIQFVQVLSTCADYWFSACLILESR